MTSRIEITVLIKAQPIVVWQTLTIPACMTQWMAEPEMMLEITTDWKIGKPIVIKGFHHIAFENKGTVLQFEPVRCLRYSYLSSLSRLTDIPENYTIIDFSLRPIVDHTSVTITLSNFPTEAIFKHVQFYWSTTMEILKEYTEKQTLPA